MQDHDQKLKLFYQRKRSPQTTLEETAKGEKEGSGPEGDFKSCFDTLNHQHILGKLGNFPLKKLINKWLEAGYLENNINMYF